MTWQQLIPVIPGVTSIVLGGLALLAPKKWVRYVGIVIGLVGVVATGATLREQSQALQLERSAVAAYGETLLDHGRFREAYDLLAEWTSRFPDDCALTVGLGKAAVGLLWDHDVASLERCGTDAVFGWRAKLLQARVAFVNSDRGQHAIAEYRTSLGRLATSLSGQEPVDQVLCLSELVESSWGEEHEVDRRIEEIETLVESYERGRVELYRLKALRAKRQHALDESIQYFTKATESARKNFDRRGFALSSFGLAELLAREMRADEARVHYENAAKIFEETDSPRDLHLAQAGDAYLDFLERDWEPALTKWRGLARELSEALPIRDRTLFWLRYANTYIEGMQAHGLENNLENQEQVARLLEMARQPLLQWPEESRWRYEGEIETGVAALRVLEGNFQGACDRFQASLLKNRRYVADIDAEIYDHVNIVAACTRLPGNEEAVEESLAAIEVRLAAEEARLAAEEARGSGGLIETLRQVKEAAEKYLEK